MTATGFWEEFATDWACFDCELMPWSLKAHALVKQQYAAVGAASKASLDAVMASFETATHRVDDMDALSARFREKHVNAAAYTKAYRQYCRPVRSIDDVKLAPFHLMATEGRVHSVRDHVWHMDALAKICGADAGVLTATPNMTIDLSDPASEAAGVDWWMKLTTDGEGFVVKPLDFVVRGKRGLVQPALKCRGREYLRIIYGPEYLTEENLNRLRSRRLQGKRSLALREFALGIEGLERFVRREPLRRVHECAFGVLAMESEPVDPRL
jgi:protein phosphatase